jgi:hypothetical protein
MNNRKMAKVPRKSRRSQLGSQEIRNRMVAT